MNDKIDSENEWVTEFHGFNDKLINLTKAK
jgi:hypothetical protein